MANVVSDVLQTRLELVGLGTYTNAMGQAAEALGLFDRKLGESERRALAWGIGTGAASLGVAAGLYRTVQAAGRMQQVEIGFRTMLGGAEAARAKIDELQQFAARSPFDFAQSARGAQQLLSMGVAADDLIPTMEAAGNAVAAAGGDDETFRGVLRALGQIQTKGRLQTEELLQLSERGIPAFEILRDELGLTAEQMQMIGREGIPAGQALAALTRGFNSRFGGAMEAQAKSLFGAASSLKDAGGQLAVAVGQPLVQPMTTLTQGVTGLTNAVNGLPGPVKDSFGVIGTVTALALGAWSVASIRAAIQTKKLADENVKLTNEALKAASGTDAQGDQAQQAAAQMSSADRAALGLTGKLGPLAAAHQAAGRAALFHAAAEERLAIAMGLTPGNMRVQPAGGSLPVPAGVGRGTGRAGKGTVTPAVQPASGTAAIAAATMLPSVAPEVRPAAAPGNTTVPGKGAKPGAKMPKLGRFGSLAGTVALMGGDLALNALPDTGPTGQVKGYGQAALEGAGWGSMAGLINPALAVPGALAGATGGVIGKMAGDLAGGNGGPTSELTSRVDPSAVMMAKAARAEGRDPVEVLERIALTLEDSKRVLDDIQRGGGAVSTRDVPYAQQTGLFAFGRLVG